MGQCFSPQRQTNRALASGIFASLTIHTVIFASLLVMSQQASRTTRQALFVDLASLRNPAAAPSFHPPADSKPLPQPSMMTPVAEPHAVSAPVSQLAEEAPQNPPPTQTATEPFSLGLSKGYFKTIGDGSTLRSDIRDYYLRMLQQVNERWWENGAPADGGAEKGEIFLTVTVSRDGEIIGIRLMQGSGSIDYDRRIIDTLRRASPLPQLPDSYRGEVFQAPLRLVAPLGLLSQGPATDS